MDLSVWTECEISLPSNLPDSKAWVSYEDNFAYENDKWQILVMSGEKEKPNNSILKKNPKAKNVYYITLEPIGAEIAGYKFLEKVTRSLAKYCGGVWVTPDGVGYFYNEGNFN